MDAKTRPNASPGVWLIVLLPLCLIVSELKNYKITSHTYKLSTIISFGLLLSGLVHLNGKLKSIKFNVLISIIVAISINLYVKKSVLFSIISGLFSSFTHEYVFDTILDTFSKNFTKGEALISSQTFLLFFYSTFNHFNICFNGNILSVMETATFIIQLTLTSIFLFILIVFNCGIKSPTAFYFTLFCIFIFSTSISVTILNPFIWMVNQILDDLFKSKMILLWIFCIVFTVIFTTKSRKKISKATTRTRKLYHILSVAVFYPGLIYNCSLLYLASGLTIGIFFFLSILIVLKMPPLGHQLYEVVEVFVDEKDEQGVVPLTPIYLLAGCALPLWLHPAPCDVTNSSYLNLLPLIGGILSVGIGDTVASFIGSKFGKIHWNGSRKTIEGSLACALSQGTVIFLLIYSGVLKLNLCQYAQIIVAIFVTTLVEAKSDQIDNLVMPILMYLILI